MISLEPRHTKRRKLDTSGLTGLLCCDSFRDRNTAHTHVFVDPLRLPKRNRIDLLALERESAVLLEHRVSCDALRASVTVSDPSNSGLTANVLFDVVLLQQSPWERFRIAEEPVAQHPEESRMRHLVQLHPVLLDRAPNGDHLHVEIGNQPPHETLDVVEHLRAEVECNEAIFATGETNENALRWHIPQLV